jgi:hypothetical protein
VQVRVIDGLPRRVPDIDGDVAAIRLAIPLDAGPQCRYQRPHGDLFLG